MSRKSSIHDLPENVQLVVNKKLGEGKLTLDGLVALLKEQGFEISRSAMGRYAQGYRKTLERMRKVQIASDMMMREIGEAAAHSKLGRTVAEMVKIVAFDHLAAREDGDGDGRGSKTDAQPRELMFIARAIRDAVSAGTIELEQELKIRRETASAAADKAEEVIAEESKKIGRQLPPEALRRIRAEIYGIVEQRPA